MSSRCPSHTEFGPCSLFALHGGPHLAAPQSEVLAESAKLGLTAKDKEGKPRMDLIPPCVLRMTAEVLSFGAKKYHGYAWAGADKDGTPNPDKGMKWSDIYAALQRHLVAWHEGEDLDPETKKLHLAHALCELSFLAASQEYGLGTDDRFPWRVEVDKEADEDDDWEVPTIVRTVPAEAGRRHTYRSAPDGHDCAKPDYCYRCAGNG